MSKRQKKEKRPKARAVLFIVEGDSEERLLEVAIPDMFESIDAKVVVDFVQMIQNGKKGGDITSTNGVTPDNIEKLIYKLHIKERLKQPGIMAKDIVSIIHIVDLDGAFIEDDQIIQKSELNENRVTLYKADHIETWNRDEIIKRNARKRDNIRRLVEMNEITVDRKTVDYSVYYFSSNLDHFTQNDANADWRYKTANAKEFYFKKCHGDLGEFVNCFNKDPDSIKMSYEDSWETSYE